MLLTKFIFICYYYHVVNDKHQIKQKYYVEVIRSTCMYPLITRDPVSGGELVVTRLECPESGIVIEGQFSLGWIGRLTREQLDFVEMLVKYRGNIQKLAAEMDVAYNTARSRLDEIVTALGGSPENDGRADRRAILDRLASKEISVEEAMRLMKG